MKTIPKSRLTILLIGVLALAETAECAPITAVVETPPAGDNTDQVDDIAIWIHPTHPAKSTIIGTQKAGAGGGLFVYDLKGKEIQYLKDGEMNNVDILYNFPLGGESIAIVTASRQRDNSISVYKVNPSTGRLEDIAGARMLTRLGAYGLCMYVSPISGKYYVFLTGVTRGNQAGEVEQWEIFDNGSGQVEGSIVRAFNIGRTAEGCVADNELGYVYFAEESIANIWKYGAEPEDGITRTLVAKLLPDVEGLSIYYRPGKVGYLIVSHQGTSAYEVFAREGDNKHITSFIIEAGMVDGVRQTDGLDVTNVPLNGTFSQGIFVVHDDNSTMVELSTRLRTGQSLYAFSDDDSPASPSNFKFIKWEDVANNTTPRLEIDTGFDPRAIGARR